MSKKIHATTLGGKYGVAKAVKVNKTKATIKKVKGVKKGKCTIYVYAQNGVYKTVNIKVK